MGIALPRIAIAALIAGLSVTAAAFAAGPQDGADEVHVGTPANGDTLRIEGEHAYTLTFHEAEIVLQDDGSYAVGSIARVPREGPQAWWESEFVDGRPVARSAWASENGTVQPRQPGLEPERPFERTTRQHEWTREAYVCGVHHGLQGVLLRAEATHRGLGTCGGQSEFFVRQLRGGIAFVDERLENGTVRPLRFMDGLPYPLDWTGAVAGQATAFSPGAAAPTAAKLPVALPFDQGIATPMDLTGVPFAYAFEQAWQDALRSPHGLDFRLFLQRHSDAYVAEAHVSRSNNNDAAWDLWTWVLTDEGESIQVAANRQSTRNPADRSAFIEGAAVVHVRTGEDNTPRPERSRVPELPQALAWLAIADGFSIASHAEAQPTLGWDIRCGKGCDEVRSSFEVGWEWSDPDFATTRNVEAWPHARVMMSGEDGRLKSARSMEHAEGTQAAPAVFPAGHVLVPARLADGGLLPDSVASGVAVLGVFAAVAYLAWPLLKQLPVALLFSRISSSKALDNPLRRTLLDLVTAEPGIHFQELARRLGRGHGTASHHLDQLVRGGQIRRQRGQGFTCYFPARTAPETMAAAHVTKSAVARALVEATRRHPGLSPSEFAADHGITQATASYHVRRLTEAGVLSGRREGNRVRLYVVSA